ncbi:glutamyl-tRNA reductase [Pseudonocardia aurantiaca]|uniref:Glutamyl-tRNA reductase n=1 Tax=Pseudonocardia aurantiaca TaxID=75290 RepID=A0ABW4FZC4_9PSEU
MTIVNVGLSYRISPAEVLEKLVVPSMELDDVLDRLHADPAIDEVVVLSTCNRFEVYAGTKGPPEPVIRAVSDMVAARAGIPVDELPQMAGVRVGTPAVEHLFSVACGLDSMAVGEDQIVAQIKAAARAAAEAGTTGPIVTGVIDAALRVSKRARTETTISTAGISLARAGIELADAHLGGLAASHAVVVGTGAVGKLAARLLREAGVQRLSVASRSEAGATRLAAAVHATPLRAEDVPAALADADLLITATGCIVPVVLAEDVRAARERAGGRALFVLDLGMPPDVEPAVGQLPDVTLADIDALGRHLAEQAVPADIPRVRAIVAAEVDSYVGRLHEAAAAPVIGAMHSQITQLAEAELLRLHDRMSSLSDELRAETTATVHRIVRKFLHGPTVRAKELSTDPEGAVYLEALRQLFGPTPSEAKA